MAEIFFLAHRIPYPPDRGDKIRSWHILKHLATLGRVHLACFADDAADAAYLPALREALGGRLGEAHVEVRTAGKAVAGARALMARRPVSLTLFDSKAMHGFVRSVLDRHPSASVFAFSGQMAQFVPKGVRRFVMDFVDMDSAKFESYGAGSGPMAAIHRREAELLFAFERETAARADTSLFVSEAEAALFRSRASLQDADIRALGNGVDLQFYDPSVAYERPCGEGPLVAFTGQMDYAPNVDAASWFASEVLPQVRGAHFAIVGRNPPASVARLGGERVTVTGAVPDVRNWLQAADVVVAPLRIARGVQNKVLEAMAMARPVVVSPAAFEGIDAVSGRDLIVADGAEAMAEGVSALLADRSAAEAIGRSARQRVESVYRWEAQLAPLASILGLDERQAAA